MNWTEIKLTNKMTKTLKETLEFRGDAMSLYALKYIDELENQTATKQALLNQLKQLETSLPVDIYFEQLKKIKE